MNASPRIALVGPGAVGCVVAAHLLDAGHELVVCARTAFSTLTVATPRGALEASPRVVTDPARAFPVDWVLIATKAYDAEAAARWFPALVGPHTKVAVLQNGVEHRARFARWIPPERVVPVVVDLPCERSAPGVARLRGEGALTVPAAPEGRAFAALFDGAGLTVSCADDFDAALWRKLALNSVGALSALTMQPAGVLRDEALCAVALALVRECMAVARAEGVALDATLPDEVLSRARASPPDAVNSLLADRLAHRPMEIDARHGVIVRLGERHGVATPHHRMVAALLGALA